MLWNQLYLQTLQKQTRLCGPKYTIISWIFEKILTTCDVIKPVWMWKQGTIVWSVCRLQSYFLRDFKCTNECHSVVHCVVCMGWRTGRSSRQSGSSCTRTRWNGMNGDRWWKQRRLTRRKNSDLAQPGWILLASRNRWHPSWKVINTRPTTRFLTNFCRSNHTLQAVMTKLQSCVTLRIKAMNSVSSTEISLEDMKALKKCYFPMILLTV